MTHDWAWPFKKLSLYCPGADSRFRISICMKRMVAGFFLALCGTTCYAQIFDAVLDGKLTAIIERDNIDHDRKWIALLHYRVHRDGSWESEADSASFFVAKNGKTSPRDELVADLAAAVSDDQAAFACRFPARYEWLNRRFNLAQKINPTDYCPFLKLWYASFPGQRISINFASSYLENPSSMFGHTFLKVFNETRQELLSPTINYAAKTEAKESNFEFIRKGLFGGFPGVADELPLYRRLRTYSDDEGRDIWEYELALSPAEIRQLLLHLWEIKDGVFDYYFLDENCAYRTLSMIDVARPDLDLLKDYRGVSIPVETIRTLKASGLVTEQSSWPAFSKLVRRHEEQLGTDDARMAKRIAMGVLSPDSVAHFNKERQADVLQLAYEYLSLQINHDRSDPATRKNILNAIVRYRVELDTPSTLSDDEVSVPPESGHDSSLFSAGRFNKGNQHGYKLAFAAFQHTLGDSLAGYEPYSDITILKPEIRWSDSNRFRLQRLDWLSVQSTIPSSSLFNSPAWRLFMSTREKAFNDGDHVVTSLGFNSGRAWAINENIIAVLPGIDWETGAALPHNTAAAGSLALLFSRQSLDWSVQGELTMEKFLLGSDLYRTSAQIKSAISLSRDVGVSLSAKRSFLPRPENEFVLEMNYHFPFPRF